ncbi:MAG: cyclic nucleotide-binding domain-containing protein [Proteobacteria bacterium]|nr:cyclic nucleotide-binding domain-containing protein [Pseudomonadota bacterium]
MTIHASEDMCVRGQLSYPRNAVIIEEGSQGDAVYLILQGHAKVKKRTSKGMVTIAELKEGDIFGEMALLGPTKGTRSASVIASDGPIRVGILDKERLVEHYEALSSELRELITFLTVKLQETTEKACSMFVTLNSE